MSHRMSHLKMRHFDSDGDLMADETNDINDKNPYGLSVDELRVLHHWQKGMSMTDAYKQVMLSMFDRQAIKESALKKRVLRFFSTYRMKEAMANSPGERGEKAKRDFEKWKAQQKIDAVKKFAPDAVPKDPGNIEVVKVQVPEIDSQDESQKPSEAVVEVVEQDGEQQSESFEMVKPEPPKKDTSSKFFDKMVKPYLSSSKEENKEEVLSYKEQWVRSLSNYGGDPTAISIYGTGQYLFYVAIKEMQDRSQAIKDNKISVLSKDGTGSVLTPNIISAIKTAAAMVMPFAPAPTADQRKGMQNVAALLAAIPEISENADDYTAPPPNTIDVVNEDKQ